MSKIRLFRAALTAGMVLFFGLTLIFGFGAIVGGGILAGRRIGLVAVLLPFGCFAFYLFRSLGIFDVFRRERPRPRRKDDPPSEEHPKAQEIYAAVAASCARLGIPRLGVGIITAARSTRERFLQAMVAPGAGIVYVSPDLYELASEEEFDAAIGHEWGHIKGNAGDYAEMCHMFHAAFLFGICGVLIVRSFFGLLIKFAELGLISYKPGRPAGFWEELLPVAAIVVLYGARIFLGWLGEFEADVISADTTRKPQTMVSILGLLTKYEPVSRKERLGFFDRLADLPILQSHPPTKWRARLIQWLYSDKG